MTDDSKRKGQSTPSRRVEVVADRTSDGAYAIEVRDSGAGRSVGQGVPRDEKSDGARAVDDLLYAAMAAQRAQSAAQARAASRDAAASVSPDANADELPGAPTGTSSFVERYTSQSATSVEADGAGVLRPSRRAKSDALPAALPQPDGRYDITPEPEPSASTPVEGATSERRGVGALAEPNGPPHVRGSGPIEADASALVGATPLPDGRFDVTPTGPLQRFGTGDAPVARSVRLSSAPDVVERAPAEGGAGRRSRVGLYVASAAGVAAVVGVGVALHGALERVQPDVIEPETVDGFRSFVVEAPAERTVPANVLDVGSVAAAPDAGRPEPPEEQVAAAPAYPPAPVERIQTVLRREEVEALREIPVDRSLAARRASDDYEDHEAYYDDYYDEAYEEYEDEYDDEYDDEAGYDDEYTYE